MEEAKRDFNGFQKHVYFSYYLKSQATGETYSACGEFVFASLFAQ